MLRNYVVTALRNLARNRLYAGISILSLAVGIAAALLSFLYVRDELTFDHFIPGYRTIYVVRTEAVMPGRGSIHESWTTPQLAGWMREDIPQVGTIARLWPTGAALRRNGVETSDSINWVDPTFFDLFSLPVVAGELRTALRRPDALVLTRSAARRYFGSDTPIGQRIELNRKTVLTVTAVIKDLPTNTNLDGELFGSALSPQSPLYKADHTPYAGDYAANGHTYVRLARTQDAAAADAGFRQIIRHHILTTAASRKSDFFRNLVLTLAPIGQVHLMPESVEVSKRPGSWAAVWALVAIATLVLLAAGVNFINLSTARAARRSLEIGIRKTAGAGRRQLIIQFMGEALIHTVVALVLAVMIVELLLPAMNGLLQRRIAFDYWRDPALLALMFAMTVLMAGLAGFYPALVLSSFRPSAALKPGAARMAGSVAARQGLVVAQFAILIVLTLAVMVIARQTWFAMTRATGLDTDQVLRLTATCKGPFVERLRHLPGVKAMTCSSVYAGGLGQDLSSAERADGRPIQIDFVPIDYGFFSFYGVKPLAGALPSPERGSEGVRLGAPNAWSDANPTGRLPTAVVVNEVMARALGARTPQRAVGLSFRLNPNTPQQTVLRVIGVVPDITYDLTHGAPSPTIYPVIEDASSVIHVRLEGGRIPETVAAIDSAWRQVGEPRPLRKRFVQEFLNTVYAGVIRQGWLIGALATVAAFISALGLFGLAAFVSEERTKEIGVRKALGASTRDVLGLLIWQFTRPVLWANLIAWPLAWWALSRWLQGFASRIDLSPWLFLVAGAAALAIAVLTVCGHSLRVASAKPVSALRYE